LLRVIRVLSSCKKRSIGSRNDKRWRDGLTLLATPQALYDILHTDSLVPKRNDRQKFELNIEILEGHLGCMKSTHSMNAATWGR
ncbi:MAG: hypothetical protein QOJ42_7544, partial [Acidobacteriaceae bacterium]|nr:hypothetical protein [Acidobacteriaceae bacterium]